MSFRGLEGLRREIQVVSGLRTEIKNPLKALPRGRPEIGVFKKRGDFKI
jgi:hypothetical protein